MSSKVVRSSKFRHVFGTPAKKENLYDAVKVSRSAWDSNKIAASAKFLSIQWESGGGGALACVPLERVGKQPTGMPMVCGHKGAILEAQWNPFNDNMVATGSEDTTAAVWVIPDGGPTENIVEPVQKFTSHKRKVGTVTWNPAAANVLATTGTDPNVKIWDIESGKELFGMVEHTDIINDFQWNGSGSLACTACKDKKLRILDPRQAKVASEVAEAHPGVKGFRACYVTNPKEWIFTAGFGKGSERVCALWDCANLSKPLHNISIDNASGMLMPMYDNDLCIMYLAGKGDGNVRYYELADDGGFCYYLSEYKSNVSQTGMGFVPKRGLDIEGCEVARLLKATNTYVEPIPMCVPRKGDTFQDDLYPDTNAAEASMTAAEWAGGANVPPKLMKLEPGANRTAGSTAFTATGSGDETGALKARIAELEAQLAAANAKIKELGGSA